MFFLFFFQEKLTCHSFIRSQRFFFRRWKKNSFFIHSINFVQKCVCYELRRGNKKIRYLWLNSLFLIKKTGSLVPDRSTKTTFVKRKMAIHSLARKVGYFSPITPHFRLACNPPSVFTHGVKKSLTRLRLTRLMRMIPVAISISFD